MTGAGARPLVGISRSLLKDERALVVPCHAHCQLANRAFWLICHTAWGSAYGEALGASLRYQLSDENCARLLDDVVGVS